MAQPIGFEQVEPAGGILLRDKDDLPGSLSDEKLVVDVEGGRPRLDTATRVSEWRWRLFQRGCLKGANSGAVRVSVSVFACCADVVCVCGCSNV